jgi:spoIIIJ-associated protein
VGDDAASEQGQGHAGLPERENGEAILAGHTVSREITNEDRLQDASEEVTDFLEGLLEAMGLEGAVEVTMPSPSSIQAAVSGPDAGSLIGRKAKTLDAIQELLRAVVQRHVGFGIKVALDVEGYRVRRKQAIESLTGEMVREAREVGEVELEPMSAFERKIVHDLVAEQEGVSSFSEGEGTDRRVIIRSTQESPGGNRE